MAVDPQCQRLTIDANILRPAQHHPVSRIIDARNVYQRDAEEAFEKNEDLKALLEKKVQRLALQSERRLLDLKPFLFEEACNFVREQCSLVTKLFTHHHHLVLNQFIAYKERTQQIHDERDAM